ncbi:Rieske 2Fe-2S domain-containing protein [Photobacterium sp. CAU 1568]|uniref:Rieske 2Fe-2S domain-containing protein n=1 Tax=Photobacterium arenosum TaxID=2774143 RepID=A0ABR9BJZ2_9GAMM|nr:Rieske 2Fe-2S domain-containing protein [Photobacterium arenosum]MBD8512882.1 Rieske 2Fe-2S domain-containing protein [Photobacterium arenosum]
MTVISLDSKKNNRLAVNDQKFFIKRVEHDGKVWVLPSECPHRGGPLHLGKQCEKTGAIVCPWHDNRISMHCIKRSSLPAISNKDLVHVVLPNDNYHIWSESKS